MLDLAQATGQIAVVVGGSKGIGKEIASTLVREGADVVILARGQAGLDAARTELIDEHFTSEAQMQFRKRDLRAYSVDATDAAAVAAVLDTIVEDMGIGMGNHARGIDILVNAAAIGQSFTPTFDTTVADFRADFDAHMSANIEPVLVMTNAMLTKVMIPAAAGQIINVSCKLGRVFPTAPAGPMSFGFSYSKLALEALTVSFAQQYSKIRFNILVPGRVVTPGFPNLEGEVAEFQEPEHVAYGVQALLEIDMSGEVINCETEMKIRNPESVSEA
jgi:NAD(P)-dependent dehydrogenase (short-subunit alcohol dehydrogenase family)